MARCENYSSKLCHRFGTFWPKSQQLRGLRMTCNPATVTAEQTDSSWRKASNQFIIPVISQSCRSPTVCPRRSLCASLLIDLTFHGQGNTSQVRRQPPCTGHFVCVGKRTNSTFQVAMAICRNYSSKLCHRFGTFWPKSQQWGCPWLATL